MLLDCVGGSGEVGLVGWWAIYWFVVKKVKRESGWELDMEMGSWLKRGKAARAAIGKSELSIDVVVEYGRCCTINRSVQQIKE